MHILLVWLECCHDYDLLSFIQSTTLCCCCFVVRLLCEVFDCIKSCSRWGASFELRVCYLLCVAGFVCSHIFLSSHTLKIPWISPLDQPIQLTKPRIYLLVMYNWSSHCNQLWYMYRGQEVYVLLAVAGELRNGGGSKRRNSICAFILHTNKNSAPAWNSINTQNTLTKIEQQSLFVITTTKEWVQH